MKSMSRYEILKLKLSYYNRLAEEKFFAFFYGTIKGNIIGLIFYSFCLYSGISDGTLNTLAIVIFSLAVIVHSLLLLGFANSYLKSKR